MLQDGHGENLHHEVKLSVIIPCYNVAPWVTRCLDAVLAALPTDGEVIVVDDGSTDGTSEVLEGYRKGASDEDEGRLRIVHQENRGVSAARNRGLDGAKGEFVFFVDPDDVVAPDFFTSMVEAVIRDKADCCICAFSEQADGADDATRRIGRLKGDYRFPSNEAIVRDYLPRIFGFSFADVRAWYGGVPLFANREMASVWRMVFRRELIESRKIRFDESVSLFEDALFSAEYLLAASSMTSVDRPLYHVCYRTVSASNSVPRDGVRYCRNKLALLRRREALNGQAGGRLAELYAASCVFSALEIVAAMFRRRVGWGEGRAILRDYLATPSAKAALRTFPLSWRKPVLAAGVGFLRGYLRVL